MKPIESRWMDPGEVIWITDIDRTEAIRKGYRVKGGEPEQLEVEWDSPAWTSKADPPHSVQVQIDFCREHLTKGSLMYGGFVENQLVGVGVIRRDVGRNVAQLVSQHISNGFRRRGIGDMIFQALISAAGEKGASKVYVSATPSESAAGS